MSDHASEENGAEQPHLQVEIPETDNNIPQSPQEQASPTGSPLVLDLPEVEEYDTRPVFKPYEFWPYHPRVYKANLNQVKTEILGGFTVAFAQLPESVAFAFLAKVPPPLGLHAAWWIGLVSAGFGARPGMISGAAGPISAIIGQFVAANNIHLVFYVVMIAGTLQFIYGCCKFSSIGRLIPQSVKVGFTNGLAIVIGLSQLHSFQEPVPTGDGDEDGTGSVPSKLATLATEAVADACAALEADGTHSKFHTQAGEGATRYIGGVKLVLMLVHMIAVVIIVAGLPKLIVKSKVLVEKGWKKCAFVLRCFGFFPSSLLGIGFSILLEHAVFRRAGFDTPIVKDVGEFQGSLPPPFFLDERFCPPPFFQSLGTVLLPAFFFSMVGSIEMVMTCEVISVKTETPNANPDHHLRVLGLANLVAGFFGTIGGGTMMGLTMVNYNCGTDGRWRISGVVCGITVLVVILGASPMINIVPTAGLVGIMVLVVWGTFNIPSIRWVLTSLLPEKLRSKVPFLCRHKISRPDAVIITAVTLLTYFQNLFIAVAVGLVVASLNFAWTTGSSLSIDEELIKNEATGKTKKIYHVRGPLFFASTQPFIAKFQVNTDPEEVEVHLRSSYVNDYSGMNALNELGDKYKKKGKKLHVKHLNQRSIRLLNKSTAVHGQFQYAVTEEVSAEELQLEPPDEVMARHDV